MAKTLTELIQVAPAFRLAVKLDTELNDFEKAAAYLPISKGADVIWNLGRQLERKAHERSRLITGTYGTGKSHLALVLSSLYRGHKDDLQPLLARLRERFPGQAERLEQELDVISPERPFLVVLLEGDQDDFDAALVRALMKALDAAGLGDLMPATYFSAAAARLEELAADGEAAPRLSRAAKDQGFDGWQDLLGQLRAGSSEALRRFDELHRRVCFDAPFFAEQKVRADETFRQAAVQLVATGRFMGIVTIWDEFGLFMEQIVRDPGRAGQSLEAFAMACNDSGPNHLHFYIIAHRPLHVYFDRVAGMGLTPTQEKAWRDDFRKHMGRFHEYLMETKDDELFDLIDQAIIQRVGNGWEAFARDHDSEFEILAEEAYSAELFPNMRARKLRQMVVEGSYPLHPMTVAMLPHVAEMVAQNQRTMFTFLCSQESRTLSDMLNRTPLPKPEEHIPLLTTDQLWDYFENAIGQDDLGKKALRLYNTAVSKLEARSDDELAPRLLKVMGLFELLALRGGNVLQFPPDERRLSLALDLRTEEEREQLRAALPRLSAAGPERVLVKRRGGTYRLVAGGSDLSLKEVIEETIRNREPYFTAAQQLRERWGVGHGEKIRLGADDTVTVKASPEVVERTLQIAPVMVAELDNLSRWTANLGAGDFLDGIVFVIGATEDAQMGAATKKALEFADNPQVLFVVPSKPLRGMEKVLAVIDALESIRAQDAKLWGPDGEGGDEWAAEYENARDELGALLAPVCLRQYSDRLGLTALWQGHPTAVTVWSELVNVAQKAMAVGFAGTLRTTDDIMKPAAKNDGTVSARRAVLSTLLQRDGARLAPRATDQGQLRFVRMVESVGLLKTRPLPELSAPNPIDHPETAAAVGEILTYWGKVQQAPQPLDSLVGSLRAAPYGLGQRVIPFLLVAALHRELVAGNLRLERQASSQNWQNVAVSGESLDQAFREPKTYQVRFVDLPPGPMEAVAGLLIALAGEEAVPANGQDLLQVAQERIAHWWGSLPGYAKSTNRLGPNAQKLRDLILRPVVNPQQNPYDILVMQLSQVLKGPDDWLRLQWATAFRELLDEIGDCPNRFKQEVAAAVLVDWGSQDEATSANVLRALRKWFEDMLPESTQRFEHNLDAGKLQRGIRDPGEDVLETIALAIEGDKVEEWSDDTLQHFRGRLSSAKEYLENWQPPSGPGPGPPPEKNGVLITIAGRFEAGDGEGFVIHDNLASTLSKPEALSSQAQMVLRFLMRNFVEDQSLSMTEKASVLVAFLREALRDG